MKNIKITKRNFLKVAKNIMELEHDPTRKEIFDWILISPKQGFGEELL